MWSGLPHTPKVVGSILKSAIAFYIDFGAQRVTEFKWSDGAFVTDPASNAKVRKGGFDTNISKMTKPDNSQYSTNTQ